MSPSTADAAPGPDETRSTIEDTHEEPTSVAEALVEDGSSGTDEIDDPDQVHAPDVVENDVEIEPVSAADDSRETGAAAAIVRESTGVRTQPVGASVDGGSEPIADAEIPPVPPLPPLPDVKPQPEAPVPPHPEPQGPDAPEEVAATEPSAPPPLPSLPATEAAARFEARAHEGSGDAPAPSRWAWIRRLGFLQNRGGAAADRVDGAQPVSVDEISADPVETGAVTSHVVAAPEDAVAAPAATDVEASAVVDERPDVEADRDVDAVADVEAEPEVDADDAIGVTLADDATDADAVTTADDGSAEVEPQPVGGERPVPTETGEPRSDADADADADAGAEELVERGQAAEEHEPAPIAVGTSESDARTDVPEAEAGGVRISGLTKRFGDTLAVDDVDLVVEPGSFYGIVGPNGAGKTTTLSMLAGLLRPDSGTITVNGIDVWEDPDRAKRALGVLPDRLRVFDRLTGSQLLYYAGVLRGLDGATVRSRVADLARAFALEDALGRLVADYSVGMTKKIALAAAMIHSPRVLVLDEPFESVDPVSSAVVIDILQRYVAQGGTVILSSHGMDLIEHVCDHVAIVVNGRVLEAGSIDEVRGDGTLEERFVALAGGRQATESLEWLHSFSD